MEGYKLEIDENLFDRIADRPELYNKVLELKRYTEGRVFSEDDIDGMERIHDLLLEVCRLVLNDENFDPEEALREMRTKYEVERKPKSVKNKKSKQNGKRTNGKRRYGK